MRVGTPVRGRVRRGAPLRWRRSPGTLAVAVFVATVGLAGCALNPVTGNRDLVFMTEGQEIEMGRQGAAQVTAAIGVVRDAGLRSWVDGIGQGMAGSSERPGLGWEFHVLDDASVNAFAMPGGFIFVTRGLLSHMTNEAQLASVLGHEIGHVTARHSVQQMGRQQLASLGLGIGSVLSPVIADYGQVASLGLGLLFLSYSRDHENQADELGFGYALSDGYDTREMITVFQMLRLDAALAGVGRLPEWQSSHPDPGNRIENTRAMVAASTRDFTAMKMGGDGFLTRLDGMVYGEDPRLGYFEGPLFIHPDLELVLTFPRGWATQNASDAVTAMSPDRDAVVQLRGAQGSAAEAATRFLAQEGLQPGERSSGTIHGNPAVSAEFSAPGDQGGSVRGLVTFIEYGGATWGILGYAVAERFGTYAPAFQRTAESFDRLTDAAALAVQPLRIDVEAAPRAMSLQEFNAERPSSIPLAELAMINGMAEGARLHAGQRVKRVTGTTR